METKAEIYCKTHSSELTEDSIRFVQWECDGVHFIYLFSDGSVAESIYAETDLGEIGDLLSGPVILSKDQIEYFELPSRPKSRKRLCSKLLKFNS